MVRVRRLFDVRRGATPRSDPENWNGPHIWLTPEDLSARDGRVISESRRTLTEAGLSRSSTTLSPPGSLVVSARAPIGYVAQTDCWVATNQGCMTMVQKRDLEARYFRYQLQVSRAALEASGQGATFPELGSDALRDFSVIHPPLEDQRRVADFLDRETARVNEIVAAKRSLSLLLHERMHSVRASWIGEAFDRFGRVPLRRVARRIEQGWSPEADNKRAESDEWGVLKTSSVTGAGFLPEANKRLPEGVRFDPRWVVCDGDLLVTRGSGSLSNVGRAAVADTAGRRLILPDLIYRVHLVRGTSTFVAAVLSSPPLRSLVEVCVRTDAGQTLKIRRDDLAGFPIPDADPKEQQELVQSLEERLNPHLQLLESLRHQLSRLTEYRQAVITEAVTGRLGPAVNAGYSASK
ncbi:MAG: restriction endonuclease subunit S [Actinomycetota bacterium]